MFYPDELVEEIRGKNDIVSVISGYVKLQKKGGNHWGLCPFHNEKSPSFSVSESKQMYHCFGCGAGGNVFTFIMNYENYSFPESIKLLAENAGIHLPEVEYSEELKKKEHKRARLLDVNKEAARFFFYQLRNQNGEIGLKYLQNRKLSDETMKKFGLGYAGKNGVWLVQHLKKMGYEDSIIKEAGLANFSEKYGMVSQFWNRVMFPIQDINHRVIGFGGRVMGEGEPKYLNSPETPVFDKRRNLYGLNFARTARSGNIILCEGYMDVISMHQAGFNQAVASLGTAFTSEQANLLHRYTENVLLAYDSDGAGIKAALRAITILREVDLTGRVIDMSPYKDPDEFIKNLGQEAFQKRIDSAENSFLFEIRVLEQEFNLKDPEEKTKFHREIAKRLCNFSVEVERANYLEAISEKYYIGSDNLKKLVNTYAQQTGLAKPIMKPKSGIQSGNAPEDNVKKVQKLLLTWLTDEPEIYNKIKHYISVEDFTIELYQKVAAKLLKSMSEGTMNPASIISTFSDEEEQREAASLFNTNLPELNTKQEREKALHDILLAVKKNSYQTMSSKMTDDPNYLIKLIEGKKELEELAKTHISLE